MPPAGLPVVQVPLAEQELSALRVEAQEPVQEQVQVQEQVLRICAEGIMM